MKKKESNEKSEIKRILEEFQEKPIAFYPIYAKITGSVTAGLLLSQLLYWDKVMKHEEFYKTNESLANELCMGIDEFKLAKKTLVRLKLITAKVRGVPPTTYYKISIDRLIEFVLESQIPHQLKGGKPTNRKVGKPPIERGETHQLYIGAEITPGEYNREGNSPILRMGGNLRSAPIPPTFPADLLTLPTNHPSDRPDDPTEHALGTSGASEEARTSGKNEVDPRLDKNGEMCSKEVSSSFSKNPEVEVSTLNVANLDIFKVLKDQMEKKAVKRDHRDPYVNVMIDALQKSLNGVPMDGTDKDNRIYAHKLYKEKFLKMSKLKELENLSLEEVANGISFLFKIADKYQATRMTNFRFIYFNFAEIMNNQNPAVKEKIKRTIGCIDLRDFNK